MPVVSSSLALPGSGLAQAVLLHSYLKVFYFRFD